MRNILKLLTISSFGILISCDPAHDIDFINQTDKEAKISIKLNPNVENKIVREKSESNELIYVLKPKDTANIFFGIGTWSDSEINEVANSIENIEIETKDIKTLYKSRESITEILKDNRKGMWMPTIIEINIE